MPNGLQKIGMLHDVALGTDGRQDLWDLNWFAACGSECLWSCCRGPIMSDHVDIKRRFVQCFVLRLWRWREGCKRALSPTGRLGTACCPTQGPQGMVSANASQHTLEGMKISWVPSWALVPSRTCLQCTSACMHCSKKKSLIVVRVHLINLFLFCQCRRYAVSSRRQKTNMDIHGNYMPWYAEERKRRGSDWRTARNSPRAQIQRILVWKWTEVSVVSFCFAWFSYVLSCEGAVPAMSSKTNRMSRREKKNVVSFFIIEDWWILSWY